MGVALSVPKSTIMYSGVFDWDDLYKFITGWYRSKDFELREKSYKAKPGGSEIEVTWEGKREETSYVRFTLTTYVHIWDIENVEVITEGVKKKMNKARFSIELTGEVELDWQSQFEKSKALLRLRKFFHEFVFSETKDAGYYWDKLAYHLLNFQTILKEHLNLYTKYSAYVQHTY